MVPFLNFLADYAFLILLFLVGGAVFAIQRLVEVRKEKKASVYGLERELAQRRWNQNIALIVLVGAFAAAELTLVFFLIPNLPAASMLTTPTLDPLATNIGTLPPEVLQTLGAATAGPTATPQSSGCIPGQISITSPKPGEEIRGQIALEGTADIPSFGFYKYEFALQGTQIWTTIQADRDPKRDEGLGLWETSEITPGDYLLRLVVTDNQGNALPACVVPVRILAQ